MVAVDREATTAAAPVGGPVSADAIPVALRRRGGTARQVAAVVLIGTLVLALFASRDLTSWLYRLGDGPVLVPLQHAAVVWDDAMARLGLTAPNDALRSTIRRLLDANW